MLLSTNPRCARFPRLLEKSLGLLAACLLLAAAGCGDDDDNPASGGDDEGAELAGSWQATSFIVDGSDQIAMGMTLSATFAVSSGGLRGVTGAWSIVVTNDTLGICDGASDCTDGGEFAVQDGVLYFDPGTEDEVGWQYSVGGSTLTMSADIDGSATDLTLTRI